MLPGVSTVYAYHGAQFREHVLRLRTAQEPAFPAERVVVRSTATAPEVAGLAWRTGE
jgi:hypothetical protein